MTGSAQDRAPRSPLYCAAREVPLRVVYVGPARMPQWLAGLFDLARDHGDVELQALVAETACDRSPRKLPLDLRLFLWLERALLHGYLRLHRRPLQGPLSPASLPGFVARTEAAPDPHALRAQLETLRPDLVLLHGPREWAGVLADAATHGCWVLDGDLVDAARGGVALLAPILARDEAAPVSLELQALTAPDAPPRELQTSWGATRPVSFTQHRDLAFCKLPSLLLRAMRRLPASPSPAAARLQAGPSPAFGLGDGVRAAGVLLGQALQSRARSVATNQPWFVLLPDAGEPIRPDAPRMGEHRILLAPGRDYWADPFLLEHAGKRLLFVEEFIDARGRGVIACMQLREDGSALNLGTVLEEPFHLSYPQVFQWRDAWYMTVESCEADRVILYRAEQFPHRWTHAADLLQGRFCVDPTLHHHEGRWYLFANVSESGGNPSDELFLFVADALEGPYLPHPANPLVADVRSSRPAGSLFRRDGRLFRPAQCCAPVYGAAVVFNEVTALGADTYEERVVSRLDPYWAARLDGCHTYNATGGQEVLDAHGPPPPGARKVHVAGLASAKPAAAGEAAVRSRIDLLLAVAMWPWCL